MYADLLAARIKGHHRMRRADVAHVLHREWPLLQASMLLAVPLAFGALGILSRDAALDLAALPSASRPCSRWGIVFSRARGPRPRGHRRRCDVINAAVGLIIIGLKVAVR